MGLVHAAFEPAGDGPASDHSRDAQDGVPMCSTPCVA